MAIMASGHQTDHDKTIDGIVSQPDPNPGVNPAGRSRFAILKAYVSLEASLLFLAVVLLRLPGFTHSVLDWDEGSYALVGREILLGHLPYVDAYEIKPPGAFIMYALAMLAFGVNFISLRLCGLLCVYATAMTLRLIALSIGLKRFSALSAGLFYACVTTTVGGLESNLEILATPFMTIACLALVRGMERRDLYSQIVTVTLAGIMVGLAVWIKFVPALPGSILTGTVLLYWLQQGTPLARILGLGLLYSFLMLLPTISSGLFYWYLGHFDLFWLANFQATSRYLAISPYDAYDLYILIPFLSVTKWMIGSGLVLILAAGGISRTKYRRPRSNLIFIWLFGEILSVIIPLKFYDHYYLLLSGPVCLLAAFSIDGTESSLGARDIKNSRILIPVMLIFIPYCCFNLLRFGSDLMSEGPDGPATIARLIAADSDHKSRPIWIVNAEPEIYLLSDAMSATMFGFPHHLLEKRYSGLIPRDQDTEIERIMNSTPLYVILETTSSGQWNKDVHVPSVRQEIIGHWINQTYEPVRAVPFKDKILTLYKVK
jgi:4-amino-4-deoxy-L-arabinose transferase-like glycosyltransferase